MKTYVLTLSKTFPVTHKRAGEYTDFKPKFYAAVNNMPCYRRKLHTIRANYDLWSRRFEEITAGKAMLSVRQWTGKPYRSKQVEIRTLTKDDLIGIQKLEIVKEKYNSRTIYLLYIDGKQVDGSMLRVLAENDGLSTDDWIEWFKHYNFNKPLAIIHFTPLRYDPRLC